MSKMFRVEISGGGGAFIEDGRKLIYRLKKG